ncbi:MAG: hypothetical protein ACM3US_11150 [Sphingomonadaceae bacterium]
MNDPMLASEDSTQSFVLRIWEEEPGERRGSIRHVQSRSQRGFTRLSQAMEFVEMHLGSLSPERPIGRAAQAFPRMGWVLRQRLQLVGVAAALLLCLGVIVYQPPGPTAGLMGTAAAWGADGDWMLFLAGVVVGGGAMWLWHRVGG